MPNMQFTDGLSERAGAPAADADERQAAEDDEDADECGARSCTVAGAGER